MGGSTWQKIRRDVIAVGVCAYCGRTTADLVVDHVRPLAQGGSNAQDAEERKRNPADQKTSGKMVQDVHRVHFKC